MEPKQHYLILDGLRGVAALIVVLYHLFEAVAFSAGKLEQDMFNGFLAVDFFFILSGFVMGYAYDDRMESMGVKNFIKRRLIRLHPMVVIGVIIGLACFGIQGFESWDGGKVTISSIMMCTLLSLFLIPSCGSADLRGNTEMFSLNGPHWSLFFEYIASLFYAFLLYKISSKSLKILAIVSGVALFSIGLFGPANSIAYGWSYEPLNILGGLIRVSFGYSMGLLLARKFRNEDKKQVKIPLFAVCAIVLCAVMTVPSLGSVWLNVVYQMSVVVVVFPIIIWYGARGNVMCIRKGLVSLLGRLSYPLYAVHYPFIYLYINWINKNQHPFGAQWWASPLAVAIISLIAGLLCMALYDQPIRKWLRKRFILYYDVK